MKSNVPALWRAIPIVLTMVTVWSVAAQPLPTQTIQPRPARGIATRPVALPARAPATPTKRIILIQPPPTVVAARHGTASPNYSPPQPLTALAWDAESKEVVAEAGQAKSEFVFTLTNIIDEAVLINSVRTSCGCTVAKLPSTPWKIEPGETGPIEVTMDLRGKSGTITKAVTVSSDHGTKSLIVKTTIPAVTASATRGNMDRLRNMQTALADRQAVFKGDCATCHVDEGKGKLGKELYVASCGICHDSEHRAGAVPDLHGLPHPTDAAYWDHWIRNGKDNTMMPAFDAKHGGPLTEGQIQSLVQYLVTAIPSRPIVEPSELILVPEPEKSGAGQSPQSP